MVFEIGIFSNAIDTGVSQNSVYLSMGFAAVNVIVQGWRIKLEKTAVEESFVKYCVTCLTGRVGWVPFVDEIEMLLTTEAIFDYDDETKSNPIIQTISYRIKYDYPCGVSHIFHKKGQISFDFSDATIKEFINMVETTQVHLSHERKNLFNYEAKENNDNYILRIDFGNSLRLLSFQNLSSLFKVCKEKQIQIIGMKINSGKSSESNGSNKTIEVEKGIDLLIKNSIDISAMNGIDTRISTLARDSFGVPYLFDMLDYQSVVKNSKRIFYSLIDYGFDVNIVDINSKESIFYKLIHMMDMKTIKYIINLLMDKKEHQIYLNYYNNNHRSPLYYAIYHHKQEKRDRNKKLEKMRQRVKYLANYLAKLKLLQKKENLEKFQQKYQLIIND